MAKAKKVKKKINKKTSAKAAPKATTKKTPARRSAAKAAKRAPAKKTARGLQLASVAPSLTVDDAAASLAWYCDVLGFILEQRWEHEGTLRGGELRAGNVTMYIGQDDWQKGRDRVKGQGVRIYWNTDQDVDLLAAAIKARGGTLATEPKEQYGVRSFDIIDPTGYTITIASER